MQVFSKLLSNAFGSVLSTKKSTFYGKKVSNFYTFFTLVLFSLGPNVVLASPTALLCLDFYRAEFRGLGVVWTPYSVKDSVETPEVLNDSFIQFALANEGFRKYLVQLGSEGKSNITDFKMIADAVPKYSKRKGPRFLVSISGTPILDPAKLSFEQLLSYIFKNYKLADSQSVQRSYLPTDVKRANHPLLDELATQGLDSKGAVGVAVQAVHEKWEELLQVSSKISRSTLLNVPNPYIVAGGRFRESYYWDSLWIMKGLIESGYGKIAKGMIENIVFLFEKYNIIPNGNRFYYLTRTQFPVFMEMVKLLESNGILDFTGANVKSINQSQTKPIRSLETRILVVAEKYYLSIWKGTERYKPELGLFSYSDGAGGSGNHSKVVIRPETGLAEPRSKELHSQRVYAESGWDMSYSRFGSDPQNWLPVDLNFMLFGYTTQLAGLFLKTGQLEKAKSFSDEAAEIDRNLKKYLYDSETGIYMDYNFVEKRLSKVVTAASFFPFYFEMFDKNEKSRNALRSLSSILKPNGSQALHTTNRRGPGQWDDAWSWAPLNEIAFQSMIKYEMNEDAHRLAFDYSKMVITSFHSNQQKFFEKYWAVDGSISLPKDTEIYGNEEGFGWTNGTLAVFLDFLTKNHSVKNLEKEIQNQLDTKNAL